MQRDLPSAVGLAVSVHGKHRDVPQLLAASGVGREFIGAQLGGLGGPVADALEHQVPVLSPDLASDDRWPALTPEGLREMQPGPGELWSRMGGAAAVPGVWHRDETVVLCCPLDEPASADTIITLAGYEQLIAAAMMAAAAQDTTQIADMLAVLQSCGAIEQAKGVIMGLLRCDAGTAWATLRRQSRVQHQTAGALGRIGRAHRRRTGRATCRRGSDHSRCGCSAGRRIAVGSAHAHTERLIAGTDAADLWSAADRWL